MNQNHLLGFALGATVTGISAYYVYKNKDEIVEKFNDLEETLAEDYEILAGKVKEKFDALSETFQETTQKALNGDAKGTLKGSNLKHLMRKLEKLQKEVQTLSKN